MNNYPASLLESLTAFAIAFAAGLLSNSAPGAYSSRRAAKRCGRPSLPRPLDARDVAPQVC